MQFQSLLLFREQGVQLTSFPALWMRARFINTPTVLKSHQHANTTLRSKEYSPSSKPDTGTYPSSPSPVLSIDQLATSASTTLEAQWIANATQRASQGGTGQGRTVVIHLYRRFTSPLTVQYGSVSVQITVDGCGLVILKEGMRAGTTGRETTGLPSKRQGFRRDSKIMAVARSTPSVERRVGRSSGQRNSSSKQGALTLLTSCRAQNEGPVSTA